MKDLKEALITKKNIKNIINPNNLSNIYNITKDDLTGELKNFPIGVVVRMLEEQEKQGNKPNIELFQTDKNADDDHSGFYWDGTEAGYDFWYEVIVDGKFNIFYKKYPEYRKYDAR